MNLERPDDRARDVFLHREDVGEVSVVLVGPELVSVARAHELCRDPHPIAAAPYASLEHRPHVERAADLSHVHLATLVLEGGGTRGHAQSVDFAQLVDQFFGESVAEVLLVVSRAQVRKGEHRPRTRRWQRWSPGASAIVPRRSRRSESRRESRRRAIRAPKADGVAPPVWRRRQRRTLPTAKPARARPPWQTDRPAIGRGRASPSARHRAARHAWSAGAGPAHSVVERAAPAD